MQEAREVGLLDWPCGFFMPAFLESDFLTPWALMGLRRECAVLTRVLYIETMNSLMFCDCYLNGCT